MGTGIDKSPFHTDIVPRLVGALLFLKLRRKPQSWELRLCESIVFGELHVDKPPGDIYLRKIHEVAEDVENLVILYELDNGSAKRTEG